MLSLAVALKEMESVGRDGNRIPMQIVWATANAEKWAKYKKLIAQGASEDAIAKVAKEMGGRFIKMRNCVMTGTSGKGPTKAEIKRAEMKNDLIRDPRHYKNKTRNVQSLTSGEKRKFHIKLLLEKDRVRIIH